MREGGAPDTRRGILSMLTAREEFPEAAREAPAVQGSLRLRSGQALRLRNCFASRRSSFAQDHRANSRPSVGSLCARVFILDNVNSQSDGFHISAYFRFEKARCRALFLDCASISCLSHCSNVRERQGCGIGCRRVRDHRQSSTVDHWPRLIRAGSYRHS
jgi:hypothetical protein